MLKPMAETRVTTIVMELDKVEQWQEIEQPLPYRDKNRKKDGDENRKKNRLKTGENREHHLTVLRVSQIFVNQ